MEKEVGNSKPSEERKILQHEKEKPVKPEDRGGHISDTGSGRGHRQSEAIGSVRRLPGDRVRESNALSQRPRWL